MNLVTRRRDIQIPLAHEWQVLAAAGVIEVTCAFAQKWFSQFSLRFPAAFSRFSFYPDCCCRRWRASGMVYQSSGYGLGGRRPEEGPPPRSALLRGYLEFRQIDHQITATSRQAPPPPSCQQNSVCWPANHPA